MIAGRSLHRKQFPVFPNAPWRGRYQVLTTLPSRSYQHRWPIRWLTRWWMMIGSGWYWLWIVIQWCWSLGNNWGHEATMMDDWLAKLFNLVASTITPRSCTNILCMPGNILLVIFVAKNDLVTCHWLCISLPLPHVMPQDFGSSSFGVRFPGTRRDPKTHGWWLPTPHGR